MRSCIAIIVALLIIPACEKSPEETSVQETSAGGTDQPYDGFQQDLVDLRDTFLIEKQNIRASSGKAISAAHRVFSGMTFIGMPKDDVLRLMGDPETISDYGQKKGQGKDDPLVYRFDHGWGGNQWTILFQNGVVTKVEHVGLE